MRAPKDRRATKICVMCAEDIKAAASKCSHCGSYQSWLGRISNWTTVLSLLVALVAVGSAAVPIIKTATTPAQASFVLSDPEINPGEVSFRASNVGGEGGIVDYAIVTIPQKSAGQPYMYALEPKVRDHDIEIAPGSSARLTFVFDRRKFVQPKISADDAPCTIEVADLVREVSCDEVRLLTGPARPPSDPKGLLPEEGPRPLATPSKWQRYPSG